MKYQKNQSKRISGEQTQTAQRQINKVDLFGDYMKQDNNVDVFQKHHGLNDLLESLPSLNSSQEESENSIFNLGSLSNYQNDDNGNLRFPYQLDLCDQPFRIFPCPISTNNQKQMSQQSFNDERESKSDSETTNQELTEDTKNLQKLLTKMKSYKDRAKDKKLNAKIYKILQQFFQQFKSNTKNTSDPYKNYPRDKNKYVFHILLQKPQKIMADALKKLEKDQRNKLMNDIIQIAKKGCWQKGLSQLVKRSPIEFRRLIFEVMKSGEVEKMIKKSRKDEKVKETYLQNYKQDVMQFEKTIEEQTLECQDANIQSQLEYGF